ncbi:MAG TPA: CocE/NonD family hydrolase, partial [Acidimicrobiales bacterium]|nr:CocE/NonD family hydrolase [Acidimicrobiales bacterium]
TADSQGAFLFRNVPTGDGYTVSQDGGTSGPLTVMSPDVNPPESAYEGIPLHAGFNYIPTRDGTLLSANITFPTNGSPGPWPVLVDYSGYDPSQPGGPPSEAAMFPFQGYVVVGINMRGTGCSGGAFDYFETLQDLDGYDAIETLAHQTWSNGNVGMVGISYMGISQLFVAQTRPPHLRAITPLSVIADTVRSTLAPGGILNTGFAVPWAQDRDESAQPEAHQWVKNEIATEASHGVTTCKDDQQLRLQSVSAVDQIDHTKYYTPDLDALAPRTFVHKIDVPTYLGGAFQDEQTGGEWSTMIPDFAPGTPLKVFMTNGTHVESLAGQDFTHLLEFVDFYVGKRIPKVSPLLLLGAPFVLQGIFGGSPIPIQQSQYASYSSYSAALAAYQAAPEVRLVWENGAGAAPGEPVGTAESQFRAWPVPGTIATPMYLQPDGKLAGAPSTVPDGQPRAWSSYVYDPSSKRPSTFDGSTDAIWTAETQTGPDVHWNPLVEGDSLSFVTQPYTKLTAYAGEGSVDLWLRSTALDTDLETTLTIVRPDGKETYVQSGWLRASDRAIDPAQSTELYPFHPFTQAAAANLPKGKFVLARVELFPFAALLRPGDRLRLDVEAPGGNQPFWQFQTLPPVGHQVNDIGHSVGMPSRVVLPLLPDVLRPTAPVTDPPCPSLRNEPCRAYLPARVPTNVSAAIVGKGLHVTWSPPDTTDHVDAYEVKVGPTGKTFRVDGDTTSFDLASATPGVSYTFTVAAVFGETTAPASDASLAVSVAVPTTTTAAPPTTAAASSSTTQVASGALPTTGTDSLPWAYLGAALVVVGAAMVLLTRSRARRRPEGGA